MARGGGLDIGTLSGYIELQDNMSATLESIGGRLDKLDQKFGGFGAHLTSTVGGFLTAEAVMGAFRQGVDFLADTLQTLTVEGAGIADVADNFEHLSAGANRLSSTLLNELREGTHNTISDFELIKIANQDLAAGLDLSDAQFRTLADGAFALAQATGTDVKDALEKMNDAMLTGRTRALEMLTGKIDLSKAEETYAASLGVGVEKLTEEGKLQAKRLAILENVGAATQRLGEQTDGLDEMVAQALATWSNFQDELAKSVATSPALVAGFQAARDALFEAFGENQAGLIQGITQGIVDAAIAALEYAQVVVDGVGLAGRSWNSFKIILEQSVQGYRAITYVVEELLLGLMKVANFVSGGSLFGDAIAATEADIERLYNAMAQGEVNIRGYKEAQDEWSVSTGNINEKLEMVRQRMIEARDAQVEVKASTDEVTTATDNAAASVGGLDTAEAALGHTMAQTSEEAKKQAAAMTAVEEAAEAFKTGLTGVDEQTQTLVKRYIEMGVSQEQLAEAYGLTKAQVGLLNKEYQDEKKAMDEATKAAKDQAEALASIKALSEPLEKTLAGVSQKTQELAKEYLALGASTSQVAKALGLTEAQVEALKRAMEEAEKSTGKLGKGLKDNVGAAAEEVEKKIRTLAGELISVQERAARQAMGGQFNVQALTKEEIQAKGGPEFLKAEVARLEKLYQQYPGRKPGGSGKTGLSSQDSLGWQLMLEEQLYYLTLKASGFREGGAADFGAGTLAMLHGPEMIIPLDDLNTPMGGDVVNNTFYVNGTAADVARKVSEEIMRSLKRHRQFKAA